MVTSSSAKKPAEQVVKDIGRATRRHFSAEDKIRVVLGGLRGDDSIVSQPSEAGRRRHFSMKMHVSARTARDLLPLTSGTLKRKTG
jgi:hypothetical protein